MPQDVSFFLPNFSESEEYNAVISENQIGRPIDVLAFRILIKNPYAKEVVQFFCKTVSIAKRGAILFFPDKKNALLLVRFLQIMHY
jgi:hypothetical protein